MKKLLIAAVLASGLFAILPAKADVVDIAGTIYVDTSDVSVWQESNGLAGLQRSAGDGFAADTRVL